ncbi:MAG: RDD family protein, partial [Planctomycetota bacterium]
AADDTPAPEAETDTESQSSNEPPSPPAATTPAAAPIEADPPTAVELPTERLLVLDRNTWKRVDLPADWSPKLSVQLVAPLPVHDRPTLVVQVPTTKGGTLARVIQPSAEGWRSVDLSLADAESPEAGSAGGLVALRVEEQLLLVGATPSEQGFAAKVMAVRGDRLLPVATPQSADDTETTAAGQWTAVPAEAGVALLAGPRGLGDRLLDQVEAFDEATQRTGPTLTVVDLHGQTTLPATSLRFEPADPIAEAADKVIFLAVLVISTVLLFTFWRRVPTADQLQLPPDRALADTLRRGLAGLIDLTPGFLVGTLGFGLAWDELYAVWPGQGKPITFGMMVPGLAAIGTVVGHTAALEIATRGRSLGKLLTGLSVTTLDGTPPRTWQSLVRCLLKSFDLIAYLLL